jgi:dihydropteroate synthase
LAIFVGKSNLVPERPRYLNVRGRLLDLTIPRVMGIINVTPDSFYGKSRVGNLMQVVSVAEKMTMEGAAIIDVGGFSTRPGAEWIPAEEERKRVIEAVRAILKELPDTIVSIDTFRSEIALEAVDECGAAIINDVSGGEADKKMFHTVSMLNVPYILMHMKGTPGMMEKDPVYEDVVADILRWFGERIFRLQSMGVKDIIIDPGFGFGKTADQNFEMLRRLGDFSAAGLPLLAGISRKSMVWKTLGITPDEALNGTTVLNTVALLNGCSILRVHDVKEAVEAVKLAEKLKHGSTL